LKYIFITSYNYLLSLLIKRIKSISLLSLKKICP